MRILYSKRSEFLGKIEKAISQNRNTLLFGTPISIQFSPQGYNGEVRVKIDRSNSATFWTNWEGSDPTRFPARIKAAASALYARGCFGEYIISHETGILTIEYSGSQVNALLSNESRDLDELEIENNEGIPDLELVNRGMIADATRKEREEITFTNSIGMEFVLVPEGEFTMGSHEYDCAQPMHKVKILNPFYLGTFPVTQREWEAVMDKNPSVFKGNDLPVEQVSWDEVQKFIQKLNAKEGPDKYRLPSEAEWEYACRAGTTTRYSFGDSDSELGEYAWYEKNSGGKTHPVGQKKPNPWGLYDMHGNVWEWVQDIYHSIYNGAPTDGSAWEEHGAQKVCRGGSCISYARDCRSTNRYQSGQNFRFFDLGFRLVRLASTMLEQQ